MTVTNSSTTTPTITPIFIEIGVNGDMAEALENRIALEIILIDAYCPTKPLDGQRFRQIINPNKAISPIAQQRYRITTEEAAKCSTLNEVWNQFREWAVPTKQSATRVILIGHQIYEFSGKFLKTETAKVGREIPKTWKMFDTSYLTVFLNDYRAFKDKNLPDISVAVGIDGAGNSSSDVHELLTMMANKSPLENLYPLMLDPNPIKNVGTFLKALQPPAKRSNTKAKKDEKELRAVYTALCSTVAAAKINAVTRFIFFDTETTGLPQGGIQPGVVEFSGYDPARNEYFTTLLNPERDISVGAGRIHGISYDMVRHEPIFSEMLPGLIRWVEEPIDGVKPEVVFLAYNKKFDWPVMQQNAIRGGMRIPDSWKTFCVFELCKMLDIPKMPNQQLVTISANYRHKPTIAHRAQGDTDATVGIFREFLGKMHIIRAYEEIAAACKVLEEPEEYIAGLIFSNGGPNPFPSSSSKLVEMNDYSTAAVNRAPGLIKRIKAKPTMSSATTSALSAPIFASTAQTTVHNRKREVNSSLAIKIAAQMAVEMATIISDSSTAQTPSNKSAEPETVVSSANNAAARASSLSSLSDSESDDEVPAVKGKKVQREVDDGAESDPDFVPRPAKRLRSRAPVIHDDSSSEVDVMPAAVK